MGFFFIVVVFVWLLFFLWGVSPVPSLNDFAVSSVCLRFVAHPGSCHYLYKYFFLTFRILTPILAFKKIMWKMPIMIGKKNVSSKKNSWCYWKFFVNICLQLFSERLFKVNICCVQSWEKTNTRSMIKGRLSEIINAHLYLWKPLIFSLLIGFLKRLVAYTFLVFGFFFTFNLFLFSSYILARNKLFSIFSGF